MNRPVAKTVEELRAYLQRSAPFLAPKAGRKSGLRIVDRLLGGGFPKGAITVITGRAGTGRMTLAAALVAKETQSGRPAAWIDGSASLYPPALALHGVQLERLLMIRSSGTLAIRAGEQVLQSRMFGVLVVGGLGRTLSPTRVRRLQSLSEGTDMTTVLIVEPSVARQITHVALKLDITRRHHGIVIRVEKDRANAPGRRAILEITDDTLGTDGLEGDNATETESTEDEDSRTENRSNGLNGLNGSNGSSRSNGPYDARTLRRP